MNGYGLQLRVCALVIAVVFISGCFGYTHRTGVVHGVIQINGSGLAGNFSRYYVEHGAGLNPSNWSDSGVNLTGNGTSQVNESVLALWDSSSAADGYHTIRLTVVSGDNVSSQDLLYVFVDNVLLISPENGSTIYLNETVNITGGAAGPDFQSYTLEYSLAEQPYNWSSEGVTLIGNGTVPVIYGTLGFWNASSLSPGREYILRLSVYDSGGFLDGDNITVGVGVICLQVTEDTTLSENLTGYNACITVAADNVTIDCAGHYLLRGGIDWDYGIFLNETSGVTVKNCVIEDYKYGIYLDNASNSYLVNNTVLNGSNYSIYLMESTGNNLSDNILGNTVKDGIRLYKSDNNAVSGNIATNNQDYGIYLYRSSGNVVFDNLASENTNYGIYVSTSSDGNNLSNNTVSENSDPGIYVRHSTGNTLTGNSITNNTGHGIYFFEANGNTFNGNTVVNNSGFGVYISSSRSINASNNSLVNDGFYLLGSSPSYFNTHLIDTSNTVNGKPVQYLKDSSNTQVSAGAGQVILANASNITIANQNLSGGSVGLQLAYSSLCSILNNSADLNQYGIYLYESDGNTLAENTFNENARYAIRLESSKNNTLTNNNATLSGLHGLTADSESTGNTLYWNRICQNNRDDGLFYDIYDPANTTGTNNTCDTANQYNDTASAGCTHPCHTGTTINLTIGWNLIAIPYIV